MQFSYSLSSSYLPHLPPALLLVAQGVRQGQERMGSAGQRGGREADGSVSLGVWGPLPESTQSLHFSYSWLNVS